MKKKFNDWLIDNNKIILFYDQNINEKQIMNLLIKNLNHKYNITTYKQVYPIIKVNKNNTKKVKFIEKNNEIYQFNKNDFKVKDDIYITNTFKNTEKYKKYIFIIQISYSNNWFNMIKIISENYNLTPVYLSILPEYQVDLYNCNNNMNNINDAIISNYPKKQIIYTNKLIENLIIYSDIYYNDYKNFINNDKCLLITNQIPLIEVDTYILHILDDINIDKILEKINMHKIYVYPKINSKLNQVIEQIKNIDVKIKKIKKYSYKIIYDEEYYIID